MPQRFLILTFCWIVACGADGPVSSAEKKSPQFSEAEQKVENEAVEKEETMGPLNLEIVAVYPHDPTAFTQGLLWHEGFLWESTGQNGGSSIRQVELATGLVIDKVDLEEALFGEGLARVGSTLIQLTYRAGMAIYWDLDPLKRRELRPYEGEGWGLCYNGVDLVMSDGSDTLTFRDPESFAIRRMMRVQDEGRPTALLNELECVGDAIWANVYTSDRLVRIDSTSGRVTAVVEAGGLLDPVTASTVDVMNGIAYRPETETFLITGKYWPDLFEVKFLAP